MDALPLQDETSNPNLQRQVNDLRTLKSKMNTNARIIPEMSKASPASTDKTQSTEVQNEMQDTSPSPAARTIDYRRTSEAIIDAVRVAKGNLQFTKAERMELCNMLACTSGHACAKPMHLTSMAALICITVVIFLLGLRRRGV